MDDHTTTAWLESLQYLPPPLRDFHDQKEIFKAMHEIIDVQGHGYVDAVNWRAGQCYVIDIFLWFMARRGYTLQRSRAKVPFRDLDADVKEVRDQRFAASPFSPAAQPTTSAKE